MKDLPKVFANKIDDDLNNTQEFFYGNERSIKLEKNKDNISINKKINDIFSSKDFIYKCKVRICFLDREEDKIIIGKTNNNLITIDGELIKIIDIINITKI